MKDIGPGDVVICLDGEHIDMKPLTVGARYCVRSMDDGYDMTTGEFGAGLRLEGVVNGGNAAGEYLYPIESFRPIDDGDAEIFRDMIRLPERNPEPVA